MQFNHRSNRFILRAAVGVAALTVALSSASAVSIGWNFTDDDANFDLGTPLSFSLSQFGIGNSLGTVTDPVNATSASNTYVGASASGNIGNAVKIGALDPATSAYLNLTITPDSGFAIVVDDFDFGTRSTATGPQAFSLRSSLDGFATDITAGTILNNSVWTFMNQTFTPVIGAGNVPVELRLYLYGGAGNPGMGTENSRFDDISIGISAVAVPEPTAFSGLIGGSALLALIRRRRS